jgi:hypothetical protein
METDVGEGVTWQGAVTAIGDLGVSPALHTSPAPLAVVTASRAA